MLAISVTFLTGRYVATSFDDRSSAEWPPHPARLFSAMVAEWGAPDEPDPAEAGVLRRLEAFAPPLITAQVAEPRTVVTHYVPVNNPSVLGEGKILGAIKKAEDARARIASDELSARARTKAESDLAQALDVRRAITGSAASSSNSLPSVRMKQARTFPSVTIQPEANGAAVVGFQWPDAQLTDAELATLDRLLARTTRLGHSSSLVSCRLDEGGFDVEPTHWPHEGTGSPTIPLRVTSEGQLDALMADHSRHRGVAPRTLPASRIRYRSTPLPRPVDRAATSGDWFAFDLAPRLGARSLASITTAFRQRLTSYLEPGVTDALSSVSILGLPNVGHAHASGDLLGVAVLLTLGVESIPRRQTLRAIGRFLEEDPVLQVGSLRVNCTRDRGGMVTLTRQRWEGILTRAGELQPSTTWVSATPVVVAGSPAKHLPPQQYEGWVADWLSDSCQRLGLPCPVDVVASAQPILMGTPPVRTYPPFVQGGRVRRLTHVRVQFAEPVWGPIVLGGGRSSGFGLLLPVEDAS